MANRNTLHVSKLNDFRDWLEADGWEIFPCKGYYEMLRAIKGYRVLIVYKRLGDIQHYTVGDKYVGVVKAFLKDKKRLTKITNRKEKS